MATNTVRAFPLQTFETENLAGTASSSADDRIVSIIGSGLDAASTDVPMEFLTGLRREWGLDLEIDTSLIPLRSATRPSGVGAAPVLLADFVARRMFQAELERLFSEVILEDGYEHPAEACLRRELAGASSRTWIEEIIRGDSRIRRDLLVALGRLPVSLMGEWGVGVACIALGSNDERVRYGAVRALENWRGAAAIELLREYVESEKVPWLADYARRVHRDLTTPS